LASPLSYDNYFFRWVIPHKQGPRLGGVPFVVEHIYPRASMRSGGWNTCCTGWSGRRNRAVGERSVSRHRSTTQRRSHPRRALCVSRQRQVRLCLDHM